MDPKSGFKSSEFIILMAGMITAIIPVILRAVNPDSVWAIALGALLAAATYIGGRSYVKGKTALADAVSKNPTEKK